MELNERVDKLEDEVKIVKNEVQAVLLDIRESYLNHENPFNPEVSSPTLHTVAATISGQAAAAAPASPTKETPKPPQDTLVQDENEESGPDSAAPVSKSEQIKDRKVATAVEKPANEEVNEVMRSEEQQSEVSPMQQTAVKKNGHADNGKMDLATIASLTRWVNTAVGTFGCDGTETVLDFVELSGHLPLETKNTLIRYASRLPKHKNGNGHGEVKVEGSGNGNGYHHGITAHQLISSLIELEGLLGMDNRLDELTLLSMICQEVDP